MEPEHVTAVIITALGVVAWFMIKSWARGWETRLIKTDERLDEHDDRHGDHDVQIATIKANMEHIRVTGDETSADVKELLKLNGKRNTG